MYLKILFGAFLAIGLSFSTTAQKRTIAGVTFPAKMKINDKIVVYNGGGLREKYFFDLYVSALYLQEQSMDAEKIINADEEMCIRLQIVSDKVTRDKFVETVKEGFGTSSAGKATEKEIQAFMKFFNDEFKVGDDILLIYKPKEGVVVYKNGDELGTQSGLDFKKALWAIWFGKTPADSGLKDAMLGKL